MGIESKSREKIRKQIKEACASGARFARGMGDADEGCRRIMTKLAKPLTTKQLNDLLEKAEAWKEEKKKVWRVYLKEKAAKNWKNYDNNPKTVPSPILCTGPGNCRSHQDNWCRAAGKKVGSPDCNKAFGGARCPLDQYERPIYTTCMEYYETAAATDPGRLEKAKEEEAREKKRFYEKLGIDQSRLADEEDEIIIHYDNNPYDLDAKRDSDALKLFHEKEGAKGRADWGGVSEKVRAGYTAALERARERLDARKKEEASLTHTS